jgi:hypothetical protein
MRLRNGLEHLARNHRETHPKKAWAAPGTTAKDTEISFQPIKSTPARPYRRDDSLHIPTKAAKLFQSKADKHSGESGQPSERSDEGVCRVLIRLG